MTAAGALDFVRRHGIVLERARGRLPNLVEAIAGAPVRGSWWAHPRAHAIFRILGEVRDSPDVAALRLVDGKITLVHRRVWPALVRLAGRFPPEALAAVHEEHTASGKHVTRMVPFPGWVPPPERKAGAALSEEEAQRVLGGALLPPGAGSEGGKGGQRTVRAALRPKRSGARSPRGARRPRGG